MVLCSCCWWCCLCSSSCCCVVVDDDVVYVVVVVLLMMMLLFCCSLIYFNLKVLNPVFINADPTVSCSSQSWMADKAWTLNPLNCLIQAENCFAIFAITLSSFVQNFKERMNIFRFFVVQTCNIWARYFWYYD